MTTAANTAIAPPATTTTTTTSSGGTVALPVAGGGSGDIRNRPGTGGPNGGDSRFGGNGYDPEAYEQRTAPDADGRTYEFDVTVSLLCYRDKQRIDDLIASIEASPKRYRYEFILSDNGSTDGTREMVREKYPYVRILENGANLGVAGGRNRVFWHSRAKYCFVLDSDTLVQPNAIDRCVDLAEQNPRASIVAPKLVYRHGGLQLSIRRFPRFSHILLEGTRFRRYFEWTGFPNWVQMRDVDHDQVMPFDCCYGAAWLIRTRLTHELGGFDEGYFYQYEDYDLCFRFRKNGWENWYQPEAVVTHFYEREDTMLHPRLRTHIASILRFQTRNIWGISNAPVMHRRDLDGRLVPSVGADPAVVSRGRRG